MIRRSSLLFIVLFTVSSQVFTQTDKAISFLNEAIPQIVDTNYQYINIMSGFLPSFYRGKKDIKVPPGLIEYFGEKTFNQGLKEITIPKEWKIENHPYFKIPTQDKIDSLCDEWLLKYADARIKWSEYYAFDTIFDLEKNVSFEGAIKPISYFDSIPFEDENYFSLSYPFFSANDSFAIFSILPYTFCMQNCMPKVTYYLFEKKDNKWVHIRTLTPSDIYFPE